MNKQANLIYAVLVLGAFLICLGLFLMVAVLVT